MPDAPYCVTVPLSEEVSRYVSALAAEHGMPVEIVASLFLEHGVRVLSSATHLLDVAQLARGAPATAAAGSGGSIVVP